MSHTIAKPTSGQALSDPGRLRALQATGLLDSLPEVSFDRHTECLRLALACDITLISLVDASRQFFKSDCGLPEPMCQIRGTPLSHSFCQHVVIGGQPLRVVNARQHPLVSKNLAVTDLGVVAYLGTPLVTDDGFILGSLCAICHAERDWSDNDFRILQLIAESVMGEIRLKTTSRLLAENLEAREQAENNRDEIFHSLLHDMRTPLSAVITSLDLLGSDLPLREEDRDLMDVIRTMSTQLLDMMNNLLEENRLESGLVPIKKPIDVTDLLRHAFTTVKPLATGAGIEMDVHYPPPNVCTSGDEKLLYRVLINLLSNAVKFCPAGSRIRLQAEPSPGGVTFRVSDNGPGIPDKEKPTVFGRHVRGDAPSKTGMASFGLGLDFCRRTVEAHGGTLLLADSPGGGCEFSFAIPVGNPNETAGARIGG